MTADTRTLADALPAEQARVRALMPLYREIGIAGRPALFLMERSLAAADRAVMSGDVIAMLQAYEDLKGYADD